MEKVKFYRGPIFVGVTTFLAFMVVTGFIGYASQQQDETAFYLSLIFLSVLSILLGILSGVVRYHNNNLLRLVDERTKELQIQTEKAHEGARLKDEFVNTMSHELKTPLNAVIGFSDILLDEIHGKMNDKQKEALMRLSGAAEDLHILVSNILDLPKIDAGEMGLTLSVYRPNELLDGLEHMVPALLKEKNVKVEVNRDPGLETATGDEPKIKQILMNLLVNAIKFTKKGTIQISSKKEDSQIVFVVEDTGIGIPKHVVPFLFEAFRQADGSIRREYGGTGLGLFIVKSYVEKMKGNLDLKSEEGKGTKVIVKIPLNVQP